MCVYFSLVVLQPQCAGEVIQMSIGFFALQATRERNQILQGLKSGRERETLGKMKYDWSGLRTVSTLLKLFKMKENKTCDQALSVR